MKKFFCILLSLCLVLTLSGCASYEKPDNGKLQVVCTLFPYYDFVRQIAGDAVDATLLVSAGKEVHSFEPTPMDILTISQCDLLIYNGGESEIWMEDILSASGQDIDCVLNMMEASSSLYEEEEITHGKSHTHEHDEEEEEELEYDEHIWTSPVRAMELVQILSDTLCSMDANHASFYQENTTSYLQQLTQLDAAFSTTVENGSRSVLLFGDRFPLLYFCKEYHLSYAAAFHGCSSDTEPSLSVLKDLIDQVEQENIPVIYTLELSSQKIAKAISEATGASVRTFYSCQTITREDFQNGETYVSLMQKNIEVLKEGLA